VIACPRCGWFADVAAGREDAVWGEHQRDAFCADVEPIRASASPFRARLCIKGHPRDAFGICWQCASTVPSGRRARAHLRSRGRAA
jgi:hypothetical protein